MKCNKRTVAFAYLRLSREEARGSESGSITNQRSIITSYCSRNGITLLKIFADDGWSGGNFDRPEFQNMMRELDKGTVNTVITKDLSRLGRDMREASYYAEQFFPEHGIRYIAIADNFDSNHENIMAPFQFAMNEVYLRDGSRKVRDVLHNKRENGEYCACPPYGYKKDPNSRVGTLIPDEMTAPIVKRIFKAAAMGDSSHRIAANLNADGVIPPLKYRVLYRDCFSDEGAAHASDFWNFTTVKRILKNRVYLGHTLLGRSRKISVKSKKKVELSEDEWAVTADTHEPLVDEYLFRRAQENLAKGSRDYRAYDHVRKSIFSGIAVCGKCGNSLCSGGTVYNGEREKYWYLSCTHQRQDIANACSGVRIRYADLVALVQQELNSLLQMTDEQMEAMVQEVIQKESETQNVEKKELLREKARARLKTIDTIVAKLYSDYAEGKIDDRRLHNMVDALDQEAEELRKQVEECSVTNTDEEIRKRYEMFFRLIREVSQIETLDHNILSTFIRRIEVGPKEYPDGRVKASHRNSPFRQSVRIIYNFVGDLDTMKEYSFPLDVSILKTVNDSKNTVEKSAKTCAKSTIKTA